MIQLDKVCVDFGGLRALDRASFTVDAGCITGLIGPNGAGKTTAFNVIAGSLRPSEGRVLLDGRDITRLQPHQRAEAGLARTFQLSHEFARLSVLENLMVAASAPAGEKVFNVLFRRKSYNAEERDIYEAARETIRLLELEPVIDQQAGDLSGGQKKLLELGRALMRKPRVILLDEIGAGINRTLLGKLADKVLMLNESRGLTFCLIEHDLDYVSRLCSHVLVMAQGRVLTQGSVAQVSRDERVIEAYFGGGKYDMPL